MKRFYFVGIVAFFLLLHGSCSELSAIPAYPHPIRIIQPDGTSLMIQVHGDEFLHWTTCNNRLVAQGEDGYYYYAQFEVDGSITRSQSRVTSSQVSLQSFSQNTVTPPPAAIERARERRRQMMATRMGSADASQKNFFTEGEYEFLAVLVNFKDVKFVTEDANTQFFNLLNQKDYSENGATGSSRDYYYENSNGVFSPTFEVYGPVDLPQNMAYYGANEYYGSDARPREMVYDAIAAAIETEGLDLTRFDHNGDLILDNVFIFYAGYGEASGGPEDSIWPHKWNGYGTFQGITIDTYACGSELRGAEGTRMDGIGTFTHEFGHVLGLPDFYDTDYDSYGYAPALGYFSLMDVGCYNNDSNTPPFINSMERSMLGWSEGPEELTQSGHYQLLPVYENSSYRTPTENEGEYFLYEYRDHTGWDTYIPEKGLLIYHVDQSMNYLRDGMYAYEKWIWGSINNLADHQCFDLIEAVGEENVEYAVQIPFPGYSGNTRFDDTSTPAAVDWAGNPTGYNLSNITSDGAFDLTIFKGMRVRGKVTDQTTVPIVNASVSLANLSEKSVAKEQSDATGEFVLEGNRSASLLTVAAPGYLRHVQWIEGNLSNYEYTVSLVAPMELPGVAVRHHDGIAMATLDAPQQAYVAVAFSAEQLANYDGKEIRGIEFSLNPQVRSVESLGVFVYDQTTGTFLLEKEIEVPKQFKTAVWEDFGDASLVLDASHDYRVGYWYQGIDLASPVLGGQATGQSNMTLISEDGNTWNTVSGVAAMVDIRVADPELPSVQPMIYIGQEAYVAGDFFTFRLRDCAVQPESVVWTMNGRVYEDGQRIRLEAGDHEIRAVILFGDGSRQSLVTRLLVQ